MKKTIIKDVIVEILKYVFVMGISIFNMIAVAKLVYGDDKTPFEY